jgi:hypothetical protein
MSSSYFSSFSSPPLIPMISKVNMIMEDEGKLTLSLNCDVMAPKVYEKILHHSNDRYSYRFKK